MTKLSDWLDGFDHISTVTPMMVEIKGKSYEAASYVARFDTPEGSEAYRRGERQYWRSFIYCLGGLPACYRRNTHVVFKIDGDPADWYVACYWPRLAHHRQDLTAQPCEHQPFGPNFMLAPWDAPGSIDQYERSSRKRIAAKITLKEHNQ